MTAFGVSHCSCQTLILLCSVSWLLSAGLLSCDRVSADDLERAGGLFGVSSSGTGIFVWFVPAGGIHEYWLNEQQQVPV